jgi:hypothetical protein
MESRTLAQVGYNTAKRRALEALAREPDRWWTVAEWARTARILPKRRMYTYALRLKNYDLVERAANKGRLVYRIRPEGMTRLAWLRAGDPKEVQSPVLEILTLMGS